MSRDENINESTEAVQLICEGSEGAFSPQRIWVQQGDSVWVAKDNSDSSIEESVGLGVNVVESITDLEHEVNEGRVYVKNGNWFFESVMQRSDTPNANKRRYPREIWENALKEDSSLMESVRNRSAHGHLEHPSDGKTSLDKSAIITTELRMDKDGVVHGKGMILNTPNGKILQAMSESGAAWGVSSRGTGVVLPDGTVDPKKYRCVTWDAVHSPSTPGASPYVNAKIAESSDKPSSIGVDGSVLDSDSFDGLAQMMRLLAPKQNTPKHRKAYEEILHVVEQIDEQKSDTPPDTLEIDADTKQLIESKFRDLKSRIRSRDSMISRLQEQIVVVTNECRRIHEGAKRIRKQRDAAKKIIKQMPKAKSTKASKVPFDDLPLNFYLVAEAAMQDLTKWSGMMLDARKAKEAQEKLRSMSVEERREFQDKYEQMIRKAYESNTPWLTKQLSKKDPRDFFYAHAAQHITAMILNHPVKKIVKEEIDPVVTPSIHDPVASDVFTDLFADDPEQIQEQTTNSALPDFDRDVPSISESDIRPVVSPLMGRAASQPATRRSLNESRNNSAGVSTNDAIAAVICQLNG